MKTCSIPESFNIKMKCFGRIVPKRGELKDFSSLQCDTCKIYSHHSGPTLHPVTMILTPKK
jgi:hypothetical protein